jgi:circadian clock protein KaiC
MNRTRAEKRDRIRPKSDVAPGLEKCPTGIVGFDRITFGGLPRARPTLICGGPGCGKTMFALEFLIRGAVEFGEAGVFVSFEETAKDLRENVSSLGVDLAALVDKKLMVIDHVRVERSEIEETGEYDLEGLFIRLGHAIDSIGARRVVLDTIEALFSGLGNTAILRAELRRLFQWLKDKRVTAIITAERGEGALTRQGLEEYVSDCVVLLDNRVVNGASTRRMRVVKYRGSTHGVNEYPFLIDRGGISVMPITSVGLRHDVSVERVTSGVDRLDAMLGGKGYYRGSSILVTGTAGSGKSSLAAHFARANGRAGQRTLYFAFEESQSQIMRNMRSIGIEFERDVRQGLLRFEATRPSHCGLEMHLAMMHKTVSEFGPSAVIVDPISSLVDATTTGEVAPMLIRLVDFLKSENITALFTSLTTGGCAAEATEEGVSSLMDTWILLRNLEGSAERNRGLYVLKSRGMAHSNQVREFLLTDHGIELADVYVGSDGVLLGSARVAQEARDRAVEAERRAELERRERAFEKKRAAIAAQIAVLERELEAEATEIERSRMLEADRIGATEGLRRQLANSRKADGPRPGVDKARKHNARNEIRS